jgi:hypothetical protein
MSEAEDLRQRRQALEAELRGFARAAGARPFARKATRLIAADRRD